jgi:hypothetical protein
MQLEAAPVQIDVEFPAQPDQAASLSNEAERSDEIGEEMQCGRHGAE